MDIFETGRLNQNLEVTENIEKDKIGIRKIPFSIMKERNGLTVRIGQIFKTEELLML